MTSSEFDQPEKCGPPKELFELAITLSATDETIEKCLSIMQNPKADFQKAQQEAFMQCSGFATAVTFEFLNSNKVRDPNLYAGTMGRYTSGPQGIVGTNY